MDDFLVNEIYKNTQRLRSRNHVEEKLLNEILYGHKGYAEKLHKTLKKLEKTRQIIEQEYFYMEKEMKHLGLRQNFKNRDNSKYLISSPLLTERKYCETEPSFYEQKRDDVEIKQDNETEFEFIGTVSKRRFSLQTPKNNFNSDSKRKFSLDSSGPYLSKNFNNDAKEFKEINEAKKIDSKVSSSRTDTYDELNLNFDNKLTFSGYFPKTDYDSLKQNQSARTQYSTKSAMTNQTNFSNLSTLTSNSLRKSGLFAKSSARLPKIKKDDDQKRKVTFGQVELNQLEIPTLYRHSNVAMEKFKLDPHFYLPNGDLKRKFSLPKLDETLEALKNCRYIRRPSNEQEEIIDVKNIFKDICSSGILTRDDESFVNDDSV